VLGPVLGAFVMTAVFTAGNIYLPGAHPIVSGALIILVMLFMPNGILRVREGRARARKTGQQVEKGPQESPVATPR